MAPLMCLNCRDPETGIGWTDFDDVLVGDICQLRCGRCGHIAHRASWAATCADLSPSRSRSIYAAYPEPGLGHKPAADSLIVRGRLSEIEATVAAAAARGVVRLVYEPTP